MDVLFLITLACFFALFVAALAIARHIRIVGARPGLVPKDHIDPVPPRREPRATFSGPSVPQSVHSLVKHKQPDWRYLASGGRRSLFPGEAVSPDLRRPPASTRLFLRDRPGKAYIHEDRGDLSDPYQPAAGKAASTGGSGRR